MLYNITIHNVDYYMNNVPCTGTTFGNIYDTQQIYKILIECLSDIFFNGRSDSHSIMPLLEQYWLFHALFGLKVVHYSIYVNWFVDLMTDELMHL